MSDSSHHIPDFRRLYPRRAASGTSKYIKLNTNETPYPPSPRVLDALWREEDIRTCGLYSDPKKELKLRPASLTAWGLRRKSFCGNGSDEILDFAFMAFGQRRGRRLPRPDATASTPSSPTCTASPLHRSPA